MDSWNKFEVIKQLLTASPRFDVQVSKQRLIATRRRAFLPKRGIFRLLIPRTRIIVTDSVEQMPRYFVQPDRIAIFMVIMLLGGIAVELFMDRAKYPRDYPPAFIYGLAVFYIGTLIAEMIHTWKQLRTLLDQVES
ncbi:MAG: hypothetical protein AAFY20_00205 [Cyanobacteria bacterium J06639_14]